MNVAFQRIIKTRTGAIKHSAHDYLSMGEHGSV